MEKRAGFTLVELMVVIAIIGILAATAVPLYGTWRQRTIAAEAQVILRQLLDAEVIYFLEHDIFFPENKTFIVTDSGAVAPLQAIDEIRAALGVTIPVGHRLDFTIAASHVGNAHDCIVTISSPQNSFALFANGDTFIRGKVDDRGAVEIF
jgi:prepilin-type N-terminal cleavage/methylation domain-containing protein